MLWPKKIHTKNLMKKKIPAARKFPIPPHKNFSNGQSLSKENPLDNFGMLLKDQTNLGASALLGTFHLFLKWKSAQVQ